MVSNKTKSRNAKPRRTKAARQEKEELFRIMADNAPVMTWMAGTDKLFYYFNKGWLEFTGKTLEQQLGNGWAEGVHPEDFQDCLNTYISAFDRKEKFQIEYRRRRADGEYRWILDTGVPRLAPDGSFAGYIGSCVEIAERKVTEEELKKAKQQLEIRIKEQTTALKKAIIELQQEILERQETEEALRQSQEQFRNLVEASSDWVWEVDENAVYTYVSPKVQEILGYAPEEVFGKTPFDFMCSEEAKRVGEIFASLVADRQPLKCIENTNIHKDGYPVVLETSGVPYFDSLGNFRGYRGIDRDITEKVQAQKTQARLTAILEGTTDFVGTADLQGRTLYINRAGRKMLGLGEEEDVTTIHVSELLPESITKLSFNEAIPAAIRDGVWSGETAFLHRNGEEIPVSQVIMAHKKANGEVEFLSTIARDISEPKRVEAALRESEEQYRCIVELAQEGIWSIDADSKTTFVNQKMAELLGYAVEEMIGKDIFAFMDEEGKAIAAANIERRQQGISEQHDFKFIRKDGPEVWAILSASPILDAEGRYVGALAMVTDVSDRRRAEEKLRLQAQLLDQVRGAVVSTDFQGIVTSWSKGGEQLFGYQAKEALGKHISFLYSEDRLEFLEKEIIGQLLQKGEHEVEVKLIRKSGEEFYALLDLSVQRDSAGNAIGMIGYSMDISDRKRTEEALRKSESQLREKAEQLELTLKELQQAQSQLIQTEKMSSLGQLVAGVAHEINNPVNFIYGNLTHAEQYIKDLLDLIHLYQQQYPQPLASIQELAESIELDFLVEDLPKVLASMKVGTERIREIVLNLRNFSRLDEAEMKEVDIHTGIDSTLIILQNRLKAKPAHPAIEVIKEYGNLPLVECYAGQLNQVFMNILTNAIDALEERESDKGEGEGKQSLPSPFIRIRTEVIDNNWVAIRIADNGSGMTDQVRKRIFDPFFTTKPVGKGTGLGMLISYQIVVEKHGGQLDCFTEKGKGTEFVIQIPRRQIFCVVKPQEIE